MNSGFGKTFKNTGAAAVSSIHCSTRGRPRTAVWCNAVVCVPYSLFGVAFSQVAQSFFLSLSSNWRSFILAKSLSHSSWELEYCTGGARRLFWSAIMIYCCVIIRRPRADCWAVHVRQSQTSIRAPPVQCNIEVIHPLRTVWSVRPAASLHHPHHISQNDSSIEKCMKCEISFTALPAPRISRNDPSMQKYIYPETNRTTRTTNLSKWFIHAQIYIFWDQPHHPHHQSSLHLKWFISSRI